MEIRRCTCWYLALVLLGAAILSLALAMRVAPSYALPPRRTATPTVRPTALSTDAPSPPKMERRAGAWIRLEATFSTTWPWTEVPWQALWTMVEWRDAQGDWHSVEGWQGQFDALRTTPAESGEFGVIGVKTWWLEDDLYGTGPFRWVIYRSPKALYRVGVSRSFWLPEKDGAGSISEVGNLALE